MSTIFFSSFLLCVGCLDGFFLSSFGVVFFNDALCVLRLTLYWFLWFVASVQNLKTHLMLLWSICDFFSSSFSHLPVSCSMVLANAPASSLWTALVARWQKSYKYKIMKNYTKLFALRFFFSVIFGFRALFLIVFLILSCIYVSCCVCVFHSNSFGLVVTVFISVTFHDWRSLCVLCGIHIHKKMSATCRVFRL